MTVLDIEKTRTLRGVEDEEELIIFRTSSAIAFKTKLSCNPEKTASNASEGTERETSNFRTGVGGANDEDGVGDVSEKGLSLIDTGVVDLDADKL